MEIELVVYDFIFFRLYCLGHPSLSLWLWKTPMESEFDVYLANLMSSFSPPFQAIGYDLDYDDFHR